MYLKNVMVKVLIEWNLITGVYVSLEPMTNCAIKRCSKINKIKVHY